MDIFVRKESLEQILAKLVALHGFSKNAVTKSHFIRDTTKTKGCRMPKCEKTVAVLLKKHAGQLKEDMSLKLIEMTQRGARFRISLDEWALTKTRWFLNINLHGEESFFNLGMVPVHGSLPADKVEELVRKKFKVKESDIAASISGGASVMVRYGKTSSSKHQLCNAHGLNGQF